MYDVTASLNPLESRMMSLAGQKENWKLRGKNYRDQIEATTKDIIQMLEDRLKSLSHTMQVCARIETADTACGLGCSWNICN